MENLHEIHYPESWATTTEGVSTSRHKEGGTAFSDVLMNTINREMGDTLPVSAFEAGGVLPTNTTQYEKRGLASHVPVWLPDKCTQCNYCSIVCPHGVIRPFLLNKKETKSAPEGYEYRKATGGSELSGFNYSIQISTYDCTGCEVCVESCPDEALVMENFQEVANSHAPEHWDFSRSLPDKPNPMDKTTVKGSQF